MFSDLKALQLSLIISFGNSFGTFESLAFSHLTHLNYLELQGGDENPWSSLPAILEGAGPNLSTIELDLGRLTKPRPDSSLLEWAQSLKFASGSLKKLILCSDLPLAMAQKLPNLESLEKLVLQFGGDYNVVQSVLDSTSVEFSVEYRVVESYWNTFELPPLLKLARGP